MKFKDEYLDSDLLAAIEFGGSFDGDNVKFKHYSTTVEYIPLIESMRGGVSTLTRFFPGHCIGMDREKTLKVLEEVVSYENWGLLLDCFNSGNLHPIIQINKSIGDGAHRIILCYLFNEPVRVAVFSAPYVDWSNVF